MKLAIMQPYLFPYLGYFQLLNYVDKFVIHDDVQWIKGGWINRNRILLNGKPEIITLAVKKRSNFDSINKFEIVKDLNNGINFLNKVKNSYLKAPFFKHVFPIIEKIILSKQNNLSLLISNSLKEIKIYLDIKTPIYLSSKLNKNNDLKGQNRVIEICKVMNIAQYINPIGGIDLYNKKTFKDYGITLNFLKTNNLIYTQFNNEFIPNLSIIDVLMFNKIEKIKKMLESFKLI